MRLRFCSIQAESVVTSLMSITLSSLRRPTHFSRALSMQGRDGPGSSSRGQALGPGCLQLEIPRRNYRPASAFADQGASGELVA